MEVKQKRYVILYLTDWQIRMIEDFLGVKCHRWVVPVGSGPVVRYGMELPGDVKVKKMYFTDWQKREIRAETGECCDYVELKKGMITDYGIVPDS